MKCINQIKGSKGLKPGRPRPLHKIDHLIVHRFGPGIHDRIVRDAEAVGAEFRRMGKYDAGPATGGRMGYNLVYNPHTPGVAFQGLRLGEAGAHTATPKGAVRGYNTRSIGLAILRDMRHDALDEEQFEDVVALCGDIHYYFAKVCGSVLVISGHDEIPGGSKDPNKACPGKLLVMDKLRQGVWNRSADHWNAEVDPMELFMALGIVL